MLENTLLTRLAQLRLLEGDHARVCFSHAPEWAREAKCGNCAAAWELCNYLRWPRRAAHRHDAGTAQAGTKATTNENGAALSYQSYLSLGQLVLMFRTDRCAMSTPCTCLDCSKVHTRLGFFLKPSRTYSSVSQLICPIIYIAASPSESSTEPHGIASE